ncbi:MAG TPA: hypothetical protein VLN58_00175, partial [Verrucomicrobiae bacterium]|nr:hypothetical protein [Verrucomicrobiae bacterium]
RTAATCLKPIHTKRRIRKPQGCRFADAGSPVYGRVTIGLAHSRNLSEAGPHVAPASVNLRAAVLRMLPAALFAAVTRSGSRPAATCQNG